MENNIKNTFSKKQGKNSISDNVNNYRHEPSVGTNDPKATNKAPSSGNKRGV